MIKEAMLPDLNAFSDWLTAGSTSSCVYHRGCHAMEGVPVRRRETVAEVANRHLANEEAKAKARLAWRAAVDRKIYLLQRRVECGVFDYIAVRASNQVPLRFAAI